MYFFSEAVSGNLFFPLKGHICIFFECLLWLKTGCLNSHSPSLKARGWSSLISRSLNPLTLVQGKGLRFSQVFSGCVSCLVLCDFFSLLIFRLFGSVCSGLRCSIIFIFRISCTMCSLQSPLPAVSICYDAHHYFPQLPVWDLNYAVIPNSKLQFRLRQKTVHWVVHRLSRMFQNVPLCSFLSPSWGNQELGCFLPIAPCHTGDEVWVKVSKMPLNFLYFQCRLFLTKCLLCCHTPLTDFQNS